VIIFQKVRRLPFTILMLVLLGLTAIFTHTHSAPLSAIWIDRLGFAPADLLALDLGRLFTSAVTTNGGIVFWEAFAFTALSVGWAEWHWGTRAAVLVFWGVHLVTLIILSLIIALPLHWMGFTIGTLIALSRDVGPSAGYFGVLGLDVAGLRSPWRWITGGLILTVLMAALLTIGGGPGSGIGMSAGLAHLIAFPLGWLSFSLVERLG
jgi:hypothetical protein